MEGREERNEVGYWKGFPKGMRVLLVEPNPTDKRNITALLEQCGYEGKTYTHTYTQRERERESKIRNLRPS